MSFFSLSTARTATTAALTVSLAAAGAMTSSAATTASKTCGSGCSVVSRADVDGDGRADTTTITQAKGGLAYTVRTTTAAGASATARVKGLWHPETAPFVGAPQMDGVKGAELVVRVGSGAHTQYFNVFSWRRGALVAQKDPSGSTEWVTDGALSSSMGYTLRTVKGIKQLTQISLGRDSWDKNATFSGTRTVARWQNGRWTPITRRNVVVPATDAVWNGSGWNVAGLQRF